MERRLALPFVGLIVAGLCFMSRSGNSLIVAQDGDVDALYGGACGVKTTGLCGTENPPIDPNCVATECFAIQNSGFKQASAYNPCGVVTCGTVVGAVVLCSGGN
jgi:hypothetical protein